MVNNHYYLFSYLTFKQENLELQFKAQYILYILRGHEDWKCISKRKEQNISLTGIKEKMAVILFLVTLSSIQ